MIERIFSFLKWYHLYSKTLCSVRNNFFRNSFAISWNICILCVIRSQYLKFSPSPFKPGTILFLHVPAVSKSKPGLNMITRSPSGDLIFSARARVRPPNVQPFQLVTVNSASLKLGTSEALLLKYLVCRAFPSTKQQLFPLRLEPGTSKHRLSPLPSHRLLCSSFAPLPPPLLPNLPSFLKTQPIPKFHNAPASEIACFMSCLFGTKLCNCFPASCQHTVFLKGCLMQWL